MLPSRIITVIVVKGQEERTTNGTDCTDYKLSVMIQAYY